MAELLVRSRECNNPLPKYNGKPCHGLSKQIDSKTLKLDGNWGPWGEWSEHTLNGISFINRTRLCNDPAPTNGGAVCGGEGEQINNLFKPRDGGWSEWSEWEFVANEVSILERRRECTNPEPLLFGRECDGNKLERKTGLNPVDGQWGPWQAWSSLERRTNPEEITRKRFCDNPTPSNGGEYCAGVNEDLKWVFTPINGEWSKWEEWSDVKPDSTIVTRKRFCNDPKPIYNGKFCKGSSEETKDINKATNGNWGEWLEWSVMESNENSITVKRVRYCDNPTPNNSGLFCEGVDEEKEERPKKIDGRWSKWSDWSNIELKGTKIRSRSCANPPPANDGEACVGPTNEEIDALNDVDGNWGEWSNWKDNNFISNPKFSYRERECLGRSNNGKDCFGKKYDYLVMESPVNGEWSECNKWTPVDDSKDYKKRTRACTNPPPYYEGDDCLGTYYEEKPTDKPTNGNWSPWGRWKFITKDLVRRIRKCDDPPPSDEGNDCFGEPSQEYPVFTPVDGGWTKWTEWTKISDDDTESVRTRECVNPKPQYLGLECVGHSIEKRNDFPTNGGWGQWEPWSIPKKENNPDTITRKRYCINPVPSENGDHCEGDGEEEMPFYHPINGQWSPWSEWKNHSEPDLMKRTRQCDNPSPQFEGKPCFGVDTDIAILDKLRNGLWCPWSLYSPVTRTSIPEVIESRRYCECPTPAFGGKFCEGLDYQEKIVFRKVDGEWTEWSLWTPTENDPQILVRKRTCTNPYPYYGGNDCWGPANATKPLNDPVDGRWSPWTEWSSPLYVQNPEQLVSKRFCDDPAPANGGSPCIGEERRTKLYFDSVDGKWSEWSEYLTFEKDPNTQYRIRSCTKPVPLYGGKNCTEHDYEIKTDEVKDGGWTLWSSWSEPKNDFNPETLVRRRYCTNPTPSNGGKLCEGLDYEIKEYGTPIDGVWAKWGPWSVETGFNNPENLTRTRTCTDPSPSFGGANCEGAATEEKTIVKIIDGGWSPWSKWYCPDTIKVPDTFVRTRTCTNPAPQFDGLDCSGKATDVYVVPTGES